MGRVRRPGGDSDCTSSEHVEASAEEAQGNSGDDKYEHTSSVAEDDLSQPCSTKCEPPKRRRQTHNSFLTDVTGLIHTIIDKFDKVEAPPAYISPAIQAARTVEDTLARAIKSIEAEESILPEDRAIAIDMFIEDTKAATA